MLRRSFLKLTAALGVAGVSAPATARSIQRVIVIGAGPAGLSAALELAERGVQVLVLEAAGEPGGKVKGWTEELDGVTVDVEHGVHGWWHQYVHFTDLLERYGLGDGLADAVRGGTLRGPGREIDATNRKGIREFVLRVRQDAKALGITRVNRELRRGAEFMRGLTVEQARAQLEGISAAEWHADGAPLTFWKLYDQIMAWSMYFLPPEDVDAAEYALGEAFYGAGGPGNAQVRWLRGNPQTLIWEPLAARLKELGGELRYGARVREIVIERGRTIGVRVGEPRDGLHLSELERGWTQFDRGEDIPPLFVGWDGDDIDAFVGTCSHAGCTLTLESDGFACPCHGGRFNFQGDPVSGPPKQPLQRLFVDWGGDGWHIESEGPPEILAADAVVVAVDINGAKALLEGRIPGIEGLSTTRETVARFWFDTDLPEHFGATVIFEEMAHVSNGFLVHRTQGPAQDWALQTGGSVIEVQAFKGVPELDRVAMLDLLEGEVRTAWPELSDARVLKRSLTLGRDFSAFRPGFSAHSTPVRTATGGLVVAGDFVLTERNVAFMEKAVYTGRLAANAILEDAGLPTAPILPVRRRR